MSLINAKNNIGAKRSGSVLAYVLVMMAAVAVILTSSIQFVISQVKYSLATSSREQAFQISEAGINYFRWYLAHNTDGRTALQIENFWYNRTSLPAEGIDGQEYFDPSGAAIGRYKLEVTPPQSGSTIVTLKSTGWTYKDPNSKRIVQVRLRRPSWSENIVLSNDFNRFGEGTETYGKIKSNKGIRFDGLAHNLVISSASTYDDPDHDGGNEFGVHTHVNLPPATGVNNNFRSAEAPPNAVPDRSDVFLVGRVMGVPETDFNGVLADLNYMKSIATTGTDGSRYFSDSGQGWSIVLKSNGTYDIRKVSSFSSTTNGITSYSGSWQNYPIPNEGVIFVENNVWIEGTLSNKRLSIVSANLKTSTAYNVYIKNDITYSSYDGSAILGIISQNDVEIIKDSKDNLRIDAALLAQSGRVGREYYTSLNCHSYSCEDIKDTITIFGSMATDKRYGFAWTDGTGYQNRNLIFDNNLLYYPPPYFPTGTQYAMDLWREL